MKPNRLHLPSGLLAVLVLVSAATPSPAQEKGRISPGAEGNLSLRLEIQRAIDRGVAYLIKVQAADKGNWGDPQNPALTALPVMAIVSDPARDPRAPLPDAVKRAYDFILGNVREDGGIYYKGLATYNTALSLTALSLSGQDEYLPAIARARRFLVSQQQDYDKKGVTDNVLDGGIGYGGSSAHSDLSNTHFAVEALYYSKMVLADTKYDDTGEIDLDWDAAISFVERCQNSEKTVAALGDWAGLREEDRGGFIYFPGDTKSEEIELPGGKTALRSYGSMTYAGMLSFIYADMAPDDPRIHAAMDWLGKNYTLDENPGMQAQGLYYYYHTMAKALSIARVPDLMLADGQKIDWREKLSLKIMSRQKTDGSWVNEESNRWMEDNSALVTSYALLALEHVFRQL